MSDTAPLTLEHRLPSPTLVTLVYCVRDGEVLLLRRVKPPFAGHWTGPGGKVEPGESPVDCALRELREETGLYAEQAELRGVITETSPRADFQWLIFAYLVRDFRGEVVSDGREGLLKWWPLAQWQRARMPESDQRFFAPVVLGSGAPCELTFRFDADLRLLPAAGAGAGLPTGSAGGRQPV